MRPTHGTRCARGIEMARKAKPSQAKPTPAKPVEPARPTPGEYTLRHVALIVESAVAPRRMMLTGVARYIQEHGPWSVYLKPFGVEQSLPNWLSKWHGHGII